MHKKIIDSCTNVILSTCIESYFRRTIFYSINSYFKAKSSRPNSRIHVTSNSRDFKCFDILISAIIIIHCGDIEWHIEFGHVFPVQCHFLWGKRFGSNFSSPFRVRITYWEKHLIIMFQTINLFFSNWQFCGFNYFVLSVGSKKISKVLCTVIICFRKISKWRVSEKLRAKCYSDMFDGKWCCLTILAFWPRFSDSPCI